ncbi:tRNA (cytosine(38)-C(5))-methyltransferase-like [Watersipora subatra]|uniref:tRNA (cytosine(38)-C(5))-methyltransferase-like n=1 Tax=Watersipora subatra TaxID=2589382 RepID=UPI00355BE784
MGSPPPKLNVLELFCGIGGMHWALTESGVEFEVKAAVDINTVTNSIYRTNFPKLNLLQREIKSLTTEEFVKLQADVILMSPPCQPFTRVGLKKDIEDDRTNAFIATLRLIETCHRQAHVISYILVENVKGFEESSTRDVLIETLNKCDYVYQEFLLTPLQFSIPNSRLRYYCIAKHKSEGNNFIFAHQPEVMLGIPSAAQPTLLSKHSYIDIENLTSNLTGQEMTAALDSDERIAPLAQYLLPNSTDYILSSEAMEYYQGLDIRKPSSRNSCCFTKRYGRFHVGSGSCLSTGSHLEDGREEVRFFTPDEISNLMCFPQLKFPENISRRQRYSALGNSLNVYVVANLIRLMVSK